MPSEPDNLVLHLLREMRAERASDMRAVAEAVARVNRSQDGVNRVLDRLDELRTDLAALRAEMVAFRGEADRNSRRLDADLATLEGRVWDRQAGSIAAASRMEAVEAALAREADDSADRITAIERARADP